MGGVWQREGAVFLLVACCGGNCSSLVTESCNLNGFVKLCRLRSVVCVARDSSSGLLTVILVGAVFVTFTGVVIVFVAVLSSISVFFNDDNERK